MYILGLNAFHGDSSACILKDGQIIVAIEEERIRRMKHWAGFPIESIKACLADAGITIEDIDHISISRDPSAKAAQKIKQAFTRLLHNPMNVIDRIANMRNVSNIKTLLAEGLGVAESTIRAEVHNVEHHRSHLASAFFASDFEESALLSIDGMGDFSSTMLGIGRGTDIEVLDTVTYPHSIGVFYTTFTQYLGFPSYGDEYKVMGLAPYGEAKYVDKVADVVHLLPNGLFELNEKYFKHGKEGVAMTWENGYPEIGPIFTSYMEEKFGPARKKEDELTQYHKDLAASVQRFCEQAIFHILNHLYEKTGITNLCVAGGVAQNSVANGKVLKNTPFKAYYVPPAGHDAGTSIGSALWVYNAILKQPRAPKMRNAGLGTKFKEEEIVAAIVAAKEKHPNLRWEKLEGEAFYERIVACLLEPGVVGWYQGRAEFGPRALGYRSIIADPRRTDARDLLNLKIKKRESFRPFAPSILTEYKEEYFEGADEVPFMEKVYPIRPEKHASIPSVTHVDGTGRLQTVEKDVNPRYYTLIDTFRQKTGVPILLNTSFNENEPIVNSPGEALDCFLRTQMDMIVLDDYVVTRV